VPPSRDDESEAVEEAELDALYYKALLAKGLSFKAAQAALVARILSRRKVEPDSPDPLDVD
jgi:hypothetical protein